MSEKEKQIESLIHEIRLGVMKGGIGWRTVQIAEQLYNAGYRKQSVGEWITPTSIGGRAFNIPHCSACNGVPCGVDENTKFCPNCGAKMGGCAPS